MAVGNPEDLFISLLGGLSAHFKIPNMRKAAGFAIELEPRRMLFLNAENPPFGVHQWLNFGITNECQAFDWPFVSRSIASTT